MVFVDFMIYFMAAFMSVKVLRINATNYLQLFEIAIVVCTIVVGVYLIGFIVFNKKAVKDLMAVLKDI